jgi:predicted transposase YbfD/YdcC
VLIRLDKEVRRKGELLSLETRYFVSSLNPDEVPASTFQDLILRHWEVENCLHLQKDRYYEEDKHALGDGGDVWTVLTNMALSLTRLLRQGERTLREVAERCLADPTSVARILGFENRKT